MLVMQSGYVPISPMARLKVNVIIHFYLPPYFISPPPTVPSWSSLSTLVSVTLTAAHVIRCH